MSNNSKIPFVVFGTSKSGTTWLQKLLDTHPDVRCFFQLPLFPFTLETSLQTRVPSFPVYIEHKDPFNGVFSNSSEQEEYWLKQGVFFGLAGFLKEKIKEVSI